ncbi:MAG: NUDIX domain-containing protein [Anaerolineae bacterium]
MANPLSDYYDLKPQQMFLVSQKALMVSDGRLLLLQLSDGQWELPGGLLDFGEDLRSGLLREVYEETGLAVEIRQLVALSDRQGMKFTLRDGRVMDTSFIVAAFYCAVTGGEFRLSHEHCAHHWATRGEIQRLTIAANSRFAVDYYLSAE